MYFESTGKVKEDEKVRTTAVEERLVVFTSFVLVEKRCSLSFYSCLK